MQRRFFDFVLIGVVLAFAFLAASFAVRNSDFWLHLASGRLLAEGRYTFGVDPFSFTTENQYWANHAWLFDWPLYVLYVRLGEQLGGGTLVVLKALLVSLLALILLSIRRPDRRLGWPAACTLLAILAMSPRLLLHSTCLSFFFLALTLWMLWRPLEHSASSGRQLRHYLPLLLLFVLWVNVDGWFLLGPLMAALLWVGDWIAPARRTGETRRTPGWVWLAGLAVCLINPYHVHAFTLPAELLPLPEALRQDVRFTPLHVTPWQISLYFRPSTGVSLAGGAYLVLLLVGALSFLLNIRSLIGWRLLVWLTFAGLSAWLARTIPFFAVVAAPIAALNLQDAFSARRETRSHLLVGVSHPALVIAALALIGLAGPGWLQGFYDSGHHVDWAVQPDSSLRRVAETLHLWHQQGKLGSGRAFLYHPGLVHYCAYFCPEEKGFLDQRLPLFREVAGEYAEICQAFGPVPLSGGNPIFDLRSRLRDWNITHLVLYDPVLLRLLPALAQVSNAQSDWTLLDIDGQALIVGWRDDDESLPKGVPLFDAERLAFTTASANEQESMWAEAPGQGPGRGPRPDDFWLNFGKAIAPSPWQTEAAAVLLNYFRVRAPYETQRRFDWTLGLIGAPALSSGSLDGLMRLAVHIGQAPSDPLDLRQQPPALPLLAVRAARQALSENPDDGNAYLQLGLAYLHLARQTPENLVSGLLRPLAELRHIQIAAALEQFLKRDPNSRESLSAHQELAFLYEGRFPPILNPPFLDAALEHRRAAVKLARQIGPFPGEDADAFARRLDQSERDVQDLDRLVSDRKNEFALRTRNLGSEPYRKAELAVRMGLARLALEDVLMPSSIVLLGGEGIRLQVRLQLMMGQMDLIREQIHNPDWKTNKANLGFIKLEMPGNTVAAPYYLPAYEWLLLCETAAAGDYEEAHTVIKEQLRTVSKRQLPSVVRDLRNQMVRMLGLEIALRASPQVVVRALLQQLRLEMTDHLPRLIELMKEQTRTQVMLHVIAGMLAVERGRPQEAKQAFGQAHDLSRQGPEPLVNDPGASLADSYLRIMESSGSGRGHASPKRR
jgi:tetratricopeptide (TPR) repeat protein